jgi:hypothetical protein
MKAKNKLVRKLVNIIQRLEFRFSQIRNNFYSGNIDRVCAILSFNLKQTEDVKEEEPPGSPTRILTLFRQGL